MNAIEFTDDEVKNLTNAFEPGKTKAYLNGLLTEKIASIVQRIETQMMKKAEYEMRQKYCIHTLEYERDIDKVQCSSCEKSWR